MIATTDGVHVAVHDFGGSGTVPVLLAHGSGLHGLVWRPVVAALAQEGPEFHCYAFDARGHGDTDSPLGGDFDWNGFGLDVAAALDGLGIERPLGVGHSSGGTALLLAEERDPGTFAKLYCFEPIVVPVDPPLGRDPDSWLAAKARRQQEVFRDREEARAYFAARPSFARICPGALRAYIDHGVEETDDGRVRLKCRREHEALVYEMATANDCFGHLDRVSCPVMLASGECSDAVHGGVMDAVASRLRAHQQGTLAGAGHLGPLEVPTALARSIVRFFRSS